MLNLAVIGSGYWGKNLVRNFNDLGALHTICDKNTETLQFFHENYPGKKVVTRYEEVFEDSEIDAVAIATPAETHFEVARLAMLAGKHVYVEKPLALSVHEAEKLNQMAESRNLKLMVGHILLYHPAIIKLKEIIASGELGKINYIYSNRLNLGKIRSEENILWSFAPHDISVILHLLNEMPEKVTAHGGNYLNQNVADVTISVLSFKSGVKGHVFVSWLHPHKEQKLVIVGDKKMAVFDDTLSKDKLQIHDKGVDWVERMPVPRKNDARAVSIPSDEPLRAECEHFLSCIQNGQEPKTGATNGIEVLRVLNACQKSLEDHGNVVELQDDGVTPSFFTHETAVVDTPAEIGSGTKIWHFSHVMSGAGIGENCNIGQNVVISPNVRIGNNVKIQNNVSVYEGVILEDDVFCGPSMVFTNVINPRSHISRKHEFKPTLVKKGATIGANATVVCGHSIGRYAFIGAGAVVTKDVQDYALMIGNPAVLAGWRCACGEQLSFEKDKYYCHSCGQQYQRIDANEIKPCDETDQREVVVDPEVLNKIMADAHSVGDAAPG